MLSLVGFIMERPIRMGSGSGRKEGLALESFGYMALCMETQYEVVGFIHLAFVRDDPLGGTIKTNPMYLVKAFCFFNNFGEIVAFL